MRGTAWHYSTLRHHKRQQNKQAAFIKGKPNGRLRTCHSRFVFELVSVGVQVETRQQEEEHSRHQHIQHNQPRGGGGRHALVSVAVAIDERIGFEQARAEGVGFALEGLRQERRLHQHTTRQYLPSTNCKWSGAQKQTSEHQPAKEAGAGGSRMPSASPTDWCDPPSD